MPVPKNGLVSKRPCSWRAAKGRTNHAEKHGMAMRLTDKVLQCLKGSPDRKFIARELAKWVFENFPAECEQKKANSSRRMTDGDLVQALVAEISRAKNRVRRRDPGVKMTDERPRRFYWTLRPDEPGSEPPGDERTPLPEKPKPVGRAQLSEAELYPLLCGYLHDVRGIFPKRIDERKSSNKQGSGGNKWLYPDIVGMENLTQGWHREIQGVVKEYADRKTRLWSFEVKARLSRSNVREAYFQAVSNSSWANLGYLVTAEVDREETIKELEMLFSLHGIGLVDLDANDPAKSRIRIFARERSEVDWATCNRLTNENKDFLEFVKLVREFHQTGNPRERDWDISDRR